MEENFNTYIEEKDITDVTCNHDWILRRHYNVDKKDVCNVYTCIKCRSMIKIRTENLFTFMTSQSN